MKLEPLWSALAEAGVVGMLHFGTTWDTLPSTWRADAQRSDGEAADPIDVVCAHHAAEAVVARLALSGVFAFATDHPHPEGGLCPCAHVSGRR